MDSPGIVCPNGHPVATTSPNLDFARRVGSGWRDVVPAAIRSPLRPGSAGSAAPQSPRPLRTTGGQRPNRRRALRPRRRPRPPPCARPPGPSSPWRAALRPRTQPVAPIYVGDPARPAHTQAPPAVAPPTVAWSPLGDSSKSTRPRRLALGAAVGVVLIGAAVGVTYFLMAKSPKASPAAGGHTPVSHPVKRSSSAYPTEGHTVVSGTDHHHDDGAVERASGGHELVGGLGPSVADRSSINSASEDVVACGPGLATDSETFQAAATSRSTF